MNRVGAVELTGEQSCRDVVGHLRLQAGDSETAHAIEDDALYDFLGAVAIGALADPQACAKILLEMRQVHFVRWYS